MPARAIIHLRVADNDLFHAMPHPVYADLGVVSAQTVSEIAT